MAAHLCEKCGTWHLLGGGSKRCQKRHPVLCYESEADALATGEKVAAQQAETIRNQAERELNRPSISRVPEQPGGKRRVIKKGSIYS